jgi:hypothetical protein
MALYTSYVLRFQEASPSPAAAHPAFGHFLPLEETGEGHRVCLLPPLLAGEGARQGGCGETCSSLESVCRGKIGGSEPGANTPSRPRRTPRPHGAEGEKGKNSSSLHFKKLTYARINEQVIDVHYSSG